jgi:hypothetical protein
MICIAVLLPAGSKESYKPCWQGVTRIRAARQVAASTFTSLTIAFEAADSVAIVSDPKAVSLCRNG